MRTAPSTHGLMSADTCGHMSQTFCQLHQREWLWKTPFLVYGKMWSSSLATTTDHPNVDSTSMLLGRYRPGRTDRDGHCAVGAQGLPLPACDHGWLNHSCGDQGKWWGPTLKSSGHQKGSQQSCYRLLSISSRETEEPSILHSALTSRRPLDYLEVGFEITETKWTESVLEYHSKTQKHTDT